MSKVSKLFELFESDKYQENLKLMINNDLDLLLNYLVVFINNKFKFKYLDSISFNDKKDELFVYIYETDKFPKEDGIQLLNIIITYHVCGIFRHKIKDTHFLTSMFWDEN
jgi:hypothetical protein